MAVAFGKMAAILAMCVSGRAEEATDASCPDETSQLQVHSLGQTEGSKDTMDPWCFHPTCRDVKVICLTQSKCCDRAKWCIPEPESVNICYDKKPDAPNVDCIVNGTANPVVKEQSGINVTKGYEGNFNTSGRKPMTNFSANGLCPVNVHFHLGTEHYSVGQYDVIDGPNLTGTPPPGEDEGYSCNLYNASDPMFQTPYDWKYCKDMQIGQTYEVHWPSSTAGACGTEWQYQTPFYDGVFCNSDITATWTNTEDNIGVQGQVFIVVNTDDPSYYYPDLFKGMIIDGDFGTDVAMYTGSTTGQSRSNVICSQFSPITWHVDRKCHAISASSFDNMCKTMKEQSDDMSKDLHAHGSRMLVDDSFAADNVMLLALSEKEKRRQARRV